MTQLRYKPPSLEVIAFNNACATIEQLARTRLQREVQLSEAYLHFKIGLSSLTEYVNAALGLGFQLQSENVAHCFSLDTAVDLLDPTSEWFEDHAARLRELFTVNLDKPMKCPF